MAPKRGLVALAGAAAGLTVGAVLERSAVKRRRAADTEKDEAFGTRRGARSTTVALDDGAVVFTEEVGPQTDRGALFIHGSALRTDVWHYQLGGVGDHRLVFCDLRGHGMSRPGGDAAYSMETLAADLEAVIRAVGLRETVIVGHSVGGMIALELSKRRPELLGDLIKGLVLVNTTYGPVTETLIGGGVGLSRIERLARRPLDALGRQHERIERLRRFVRPTDMAFWMVALMGFGPRASARQIDFVYDMISRTPIEVIFDLLRSYRDFDMTGRLDEVTVPALVVGGRHDRITVASASEYLAEHLPKARLEIFEDCGHMVMLERHEEFDAMLLAFLNDTLGSRKRRSAKGGHAG